MKYVYFLITLILILSCTPTKEQGVAENSAKPDSLTASPKAKKNKFPAGVILLTGESDDIRQRLEITYLDSLHISYTIIASSKSVDCRQSLKGTATRKPIMDSEIDEDDEGNMYPSDEYWDDKLDGFSIRVNTIESDRARIHYPLPSDSAEACSRLVQNISLKRIYESK